ncbi:MAG TPA: aspartate-semialdehyde dehydrogenase [Myxococcaceae bacterium]|nr:aspartate-semialdehyde dehydrogenase [Myxococcaceae bacterium]
MSTNAPIAVVGVTGVVGREVLGALHEAGFPAEEITALGTDRSEGEEIDYGDESLSVERATPEVFRGHRAVILAVPHDAARTLAPAAQAAGAWVVDVSGAFRADPTVPLVLPAVNAEILKRPFRGRIVAVPASLTTAVLTALEPLRAAFGLRRASVTALYGASSAGRRGIAELEKQAGGLLSGRDEDVAVFPHRIGFNVIPQVGEFEGAWTREERALIDEAARIWEGRGELPVLSATVFHVPTFYGQAMSLSIDLGGAANEKQIRAELEKSPNLKLLDAPAEKIYPMPMLITADPAVHVGRVREVPRSPGRAELVAVVDNAGRAALNAVEIARELLARG